MKAGAFLLKTLMGVVILIEGLVEAKKSKDEIEEAEVTLSSSSEKEKVEKVEERELGLELSGEEMGSGDESAEGKDVMEGINGLGFSKVNCSRVGVGDMMDLEIIAKSSSASSLWSDSRSCCARVRVCARASAEFTVARKEACTKDCCPSLLIGTWGSWKSSRERRVCMNGGAVASDQMVTMRGMGLADATLTTRGSIMRSKSRAPKRWIQSAQRNPEAIQAA